MNKLLTGLVIFLLVLVSLQQMKTCSAQQDASEAAFRADSLAAALDTTRVLDGQALLAAQSMFDDSISVIERRIIQVRPERDTLDRVLHRERIANSALRAQVAQLLLVHETGSTVVVDTFTDERSARFDERRAPYTVMAAVTLSGAGKEARMDSLRIALDPARLTIRQQCGAPVNGVRPATLLITTPPWLAVRVDSSVQAPGACNPPPARRWYQGRLTVGPAFVVAPTGATALGLGIQVALWRWP